MTTSNVSLSTREQRLSQASRRRREAQKQELRQAILEAASSLFLEQGYEGFSLRQVAERIGYTPTTIYFYFADKDALLFALLDDAFDRFGAALRRASLSTPEPFDQLEAIGRAYVRFGLENPQYYEMMFVVRSDFLLQARAAETEPRIASFRTLQEAVAACYGCGDATPGRCRGHEFVALGSDAWHRRFGDQHAANVDPTTRRTCRERCRRSHSPGSDLSRCL